MPRIFLNSNKTADRQVELHDDKSGAVLAEGFLSVDMVPSGAGDRIGSLVFNTTETFTEPEVVTAIGRVE